MMKTRPFPLKIRNSVAGTSLLAALLVAGPLSAARAAEDSKPQAASAPAPGAPAKLGATKIPTKMPTTAPAAEASVKKTVKIIRAAQAQQLPDLKFSQEEFPVVTEKGTDYVVLEGEFPKKDWTLLLGAKMSIKRSSTGKFKIKTRLVGQVTPLSLGAVDPKGQVKNETLKLQFAAWKGKNFVGSRHSFVPSLGYSSLEYSETGVPATLTEKAVTLKFAYSYQLAPPRWDLGVSAYINALILSTSDPAIKARFYGVNLRVGYSPGFIKEPFRVMLMAGTYFTNMVVTNNAFGFTNLAGPQAFPVVRYALPNGDSVSGYFKFAPIFAGGVVSGANSREFAAGVSYNLKLKNGHVVPISIDWSNLKLLVDDGADGVHMTSKSLSFGFGYSL